MDFYTTLKQKGFLSLLRHVEYKTPTYYGWEKVKPFLLDIVQNNKSVYVEGDYDVDGLCCSLIWKEGFKSLGVTNVYTYRFRERTHSMDVVAVRQCIDGGYDYFLVADTGSSDMGLLNYLVENGVKVIVLDHHVTEYDYEDFGDGIAVINTTIENKLGGDFALSAGALCFTVLDLLYTELGKKVPQSFAAFAIVSLFADVMTMNNELNRSLYYLGTEQPEDELPEQLLYFKNQYSAFNKRYIEFWYSPRINACFRSEKLELLNKLFIDESSAAVKEQCKEGIEQVYTEARKMVDTISDFVCAFAVELNNFVYADLAQVNQYYNINAFKLYNYTGLIANKLSERYGKTAVVTSPCGYEYKGSLRDFNARDYLSLFKQICQAGGHESAFGFHLKSFDLDQFRKDLVTIDENFSIDFVPNEPIVVDLPDGGSPDLAVLNDVALYNEFTSPKVPIALLRKKMVGDIREIRSSYNYKYMWEGIAIQSDSKIQLGRTVEVKPIFSKNLKLLVHTNKAVMQ